ncbi:MAG TPA: LysE family transporter [Kofleriaceae bacterium]|nr:LysE family transporter [Kofleriaceae bacterium]
MLTYLILGLALGVGTGIPIGAVGVAVIGAAHRHTLVRALAVGAGGAIGDLAYSALGVLGLGPLIERHPAVPPFLYAVSGVALIGYGYLQVRPRATPPPPAMARNRGGGDALGGLALGLLLVLMNPAAIVTWVVIVGSQMAGASQTEGLCAVAGIGAGSMLWFGLVAYLADRGKRAFGDRAAWVTRVAGVLLMGYGTFSVGRGVFHWLS